MRKIFEETERLEKELIEEQKKLEQLDKKLLELTNICPHEVVFCYSDNHPRKMNIYGKYFCPACGKIVICTSYNQVRKTDFKNSRIISLKLLLRGTEKTLTLLRNEVYNNLDLYYNPNINEDFLSGKMEDVLKSEEYNYYITPEFKEINFK